MKIKETEYLNDLTQRISILRKKCTAINMQEPYIYLDLYEAELEFLRVIPWSDSLVQKTLGRGFQYKDQLLGKVCDPVMNVSVDIVNSLYNAAASVIYTCSKRTTTEEGLKLKAEQYLKASYYCEVAANFIKQNQNYVASSTDVFTGHSVLTGYQHLYMAMCLECYASIILIRSNGKPEEGKSFIQKLAQYWSNCIQLYQKAQIQLNLVLQSDQTGVMKKELKSKILNCQAAYSFMYARVNRLSNKPQCARDLAHTAQLIKQMQDEHIQIQYILVNELAKMQNELKYENVTPAIQEIQLLTDDPINFKAKIEEMKIELPSYIQPAEILLPLETQQILQQIQQNSANDAQQIEQQARQYVEQNKNLIEQVLKESQEIANQQSVETIQRLQEQIASQNMVEMIKNAPQQEQQLNMVLQSLQRNLSKYQALLRTDMENAQKFQVYWNSQQALGIINSYVQQGEEYKNQLTSLIQGDKFKYLKQYKQKEFEPALNFETEKIQLTDEQHKSIDDMKILKDELQEMYEQIEQYQCGRSITEIYEQLCNIKLERRLVNEYVKELKERDQEKLQKILDQITKITKRLENRIKDYNSVFIADQLTAIKQLKQIIEIFNIKQYGDTYLQQMLQVSQKYQQKCEDIFQQYTQQVSKAEEFIRQRRQVVITLH